MGPRGRSYFNQSAQQLAKRMPWAQLIGAGSVAGSGLGTYALVKKHYENLERERFELEAQEQHERSHQLEQGLKERAWQRQRLQQLQEEHNRKERERQQQKQQEQLKLLQQNQLQFDQLKQQEQQKQEQLERDRLWRENWRWYYPGTWRG